MASIEYYTESKNFGIKRIFLNIKHMGQCKSAPICPKRGKPSTTIPITANNDSELLLFYSNELSKRDKKIKELEKLLALLNKNTSPLQPIQKSCDIKSTLSQESIKDFVDKLISNKNINIGYLPDAVERQIYQNVFTIIIGIIEQSLKEIKLDFIGHEISISLNPVKSNKI